MTSSKKYKRLRLILGDQLNAGHSWFKTKLNETLYVVAELNQELTYTKHHFQKICAFFLAMEKFSGALEKSGHKVLHIDLNSSKDHKSLADLIISLCKQYEVEKFEYQRPDEYRLYEQLKSEFLPKSVSKKEFDTEHFIVSFEDIPEYFEKGKHHTMEAFYRKMRRSYDLLMDGDKPEGGEWNYDAENRNKLKKKDIESIPTPLVFSHSTKAIKQRLDDNKVSFFGNEVEEISWPVTRKESLELLNFFCENCLQNFGRFQDAMTCQSDHQWSLYHSRLSFSLNCKILHPLQVINTVIDYYRDHEADISIAQVEGFIRQILGWREFIRGMYWVNMPEYSSLNELDANRELPVYFWNGETKMQCMQSAIQQSLDYSYAHHIQRLMVTGNFSLLTGIDPKQVDDWYLGIYIDAIEWVELPNTRGMSQFADGGLIATKPYCSSGNYINKMSDYCQNCEYKVKEKVSNDACPFNSLYWHFMDKHRKRLEKNHRIGMIYRNWDKQSEQSKNDVLTRAEWCLENINSL